MDETTIEVELSNDEQRELIRSLMEFGKTNSVHPIKYFFALVQSAKIISDLEGFELSHMLQLLEDHETNESRSEFH